MKTRIRLAGIGAIAGGFLWSVAIALQEGFSYQKPSNGAGYYVLQMASAAAFLACVVGIQGLLWSGVTDHGRFGRWSLRVFQLGLTLMALATIAQTVTGNDEIILYPFGDLAIVIAGMLTGVAVVRTGMWTGWQRFTPLLIVLYFVFGMVVPAIASSSSDGPPAALDIAWGATWILLGLAYLLPSTEAPATTSAAPALTTARR
jgi:hypothetical protein